MQKPSGFPQLLISSLFLFAQSFSNASAQQHIDNCESFLDTDLTLLCYQHNIVSELQHFWYRLPRGTMTLTISENGRINDLLLYNHWSYSPHLAKVYSGFYFDWIPLPTPKTTLISQDNYYEISIEVLPNGEVIALSDLTKRSF